jgi:hypothetical protein
MNISIGLTEDLCKAMTGSSSHCGFVHGESASRRYRVIFKARATSVRGFNFKPAFGAILSHNAKGEVGAVDAWRHADVCANIHSLPPPQRQSSTPNIRI